MTDSDRALIEAAARAAGYEIARWTDDETALLLVGVQEPWNSLHPNPHSDCMGDALRLAVDLGLVVDTSRPSAAPPWSRHASAQDDAMDMRAATRRAITRAAASMEGRKG